MDRGRVPALDGLRGAAIGLVVLFHARLLTGGWIGVSLFFTLSGYLITSLLLTEHTRTGTIALRAFYRRRAARLGPALLLALAGMVALWTVQGSAPVAFANALITLTFLANIARAAFHGAMAPTGYAWSLALEEQFYFAWPSILRRNLRTQPLRLAGWLLAAALAVQVARLLTHSLVLDYFLLRGDELMLGAALALTGLTAARWVAWLALGGLLGVALLVPYGWHTTVLVTVVAWLSVLLLAGARHLPAPAVLRYLGRISYSLYLWNGTLVGIYPGANRALIMAAQLSLAVASTHLLEEPLRRRLSRDREGVVPARTRVVPQAVLRSRRVGRIRDRRAGLHAVLVDLDRAAQ
jgi:peptidoglycan/LPS O-acetylase OafA/YrhL